MDSSLSVPPTWEIGTHPQSPVSTAFSSNPSITPTENNASPVPTISSEEAHEAIDRFLNKPEDGQLIEVTSEDSRKAMKADLKAATSLKWDGQDVTEDQAVKKIAEAEENIKNGTDHHQWTKQHTRPLVPVSVPVLQIMVAAGAFYYILLECGPRRRTRRGRGAIYTVPTQQTGRNGDDLRDEEAAMSGDGEGHTPSGQNMHQEDIELRDMSNHPRLA